MAQPGDNFGAISDKGFGHPHWSQLDPSRPWRGRAGVKGPEPAGRQAGVDLAPAAIAAIGMDSSQEGAPVAARRGVARG